MHILVLDGHHLAAEFRRKFGPLPEYHFISTEYQTPAERSAIQREITSAAVPADVVFCFPAPGRLPYSDWFAAAPGRPMFIESSCTALITSVGPIDAAAPAGPRFGFCGLPTLLDRPLLEISLSSEADRAPLAAICASLGTDYRVVGDRVGLVTPRVICMIINEACYTVQEGTATLADVDLSMKLGTNYPCGPFAWANAIGVPRVYAVLEALWNDTHDERYKICPLLKRQALLGLPFAV